MEELIEEISKEAIQELKKAKKPPYPLYYKDVFVNLVREKKILEQLNPILLCIDESISRDFIVKTEEKLKNLHLTSENIKEDSEKFLEIIEPLEIDEVKDLILRFTSTLLSKINQMQKTIDELEMELEKAYKELLIDSLTKAYNKKALEKDLSEILKVGKEKDLDLYVIMIDLKHFKKVNEKYGHLVGDFVLKKLVEVIRKTLRKEHKIYRVSGDEFVIVLNRMDLEGVKKVVDRILSVVKKTKFKYKDEFIKIEIVLGVASHKKGDNIKDLIHRLYEAISIAKQKNIDYTIV